MPIKIVNKIESAITSMRAELDGAIREQKTAHEQFTNASNQKMAVAAQCHRGKVKASKLDDARNAEDMAQAGLNNAQKRVQHCKDRLEELQFELAEAQTASELATVKATLAAHKECGEQLIESWRKFVSDLAAWRNFDRGAVDEYRKSVGHYSPSGVANETSFTMCTLIAPILQQFPRMSLKHFDSIIRNDVLASPDSPDEMLKQIVAIRADRMAAVLNAVDRPANGDVPRWPESSIRELPRFRPRARGNHPFAA